MTTCAKSCERICFYCDVTLSPRHEHDHFPTAKRHGGQSVVAICLNCHDLKDRVPLDDWPVELVLRAFKEAGPLGRLLVAKCSHIAADASAQLKQVAS